jgi:Tudor domain
LDLDVSKPLVLNAKIGTPCVAQYIEDNSWYRGKILALGSQEAEVLFVDYGNKQMVTNHATSKLLRRPF